MAVVLGVTAGFVSPKPSANPGGGGLAITDDAHAIPHTSPAGSNQVTDIGFYQARNVNSAAAYECAIYNDNAGSPGTLLSGISSGQSTLEDTEGWYWYTGLAIELQAATTYWVACWLEDVAVDNYFDYTGTDTRALETNVAGIQSPWGGGPGVGGVEAIVAVYAAVGGGEYVPYPISRGARGGLHELSGGLQ